MIFSNEIPVLYFISDYTLSFFMWILFLRFLLNIFFTDSTKLAFINKFFVMTNKFIFIFNKIIPKFLPDQLTPLYLAWIFFIIRFYILPIFIDYESIGHLSLILEKNIYVILEKKLAF